jgi:hypothetical protein
MSVFQPPPTYADPVLVDEVTKKGKFNPIWLKWFLDLIAVLNAAGGTIINHNDTNAIQGGAVGERYHLTSAELAALGSASTNVLLQRVFSQAPVTSRSNWSDMENVLTQQVFGG